MPSKPKDGVRQRKKVSESAANGYGDAPKAATKPSPPRQPKTATSGGGMTCMNWFIVLFFVLGVGGGVGFFIHNEMTVTNRAVLREIERLRSESSDVSSFSEQIKSISKKLEAIEELKKDLSTVKEMGESRAAEFSQLSSQIKKSQTNYQDISMQLADSMTIIDNLQGDIDNLKSSQTQSEASDDTSAALKKMNDLLEDSNTKVTFLSDEVLRLDKRLNNNFEQASSIQKEVIDLTADKVEMFSVIESVKTTIVNVRETVRKIQDQPPQEGAQWDTESIKGKIQELDQRMSGEVERLSRQISETSENSAKWLQQATSELGERFQRNVESLNKELKEIKVQKPEQVQASTEQSVINSVAALDIRLTEVRQSVEKMNKLVGEIDEKRKQKEKLAEEEFTDYKESLVKLTDRVMEVRSKDGNLETLIDELTKQVTKLSNELNGIKSTSRIIESRVEELRTAQKEEPVKPAEPDQPQQPQM